MSVDWKFHLIGAATGALVGAAGTGDTAVTAVTGSSGQTVAAFAPAGTGLTRCMQLAQVSGQACSAYKTFTSRTSLKIRDYFYLASPLVTSANHVFLRIGAGSARGVDMSLIGTGRYRLYNAANTSVAETGLSTILADTWLRREITLTTTSVTVNLFALGSTTPLYTLTYTGAAGEFGSGFDRITYGNTGTTPTSEVLRVAGITVDNASMPAPLEALPDFGWQFGIEF